jgi:shikimate dehydrogenase
MINTQTKLCGVIGNPIEHSLSPALHNAAFKKLNLNFVYLAFKVENVKDTLLGMRALGIRGLSVTIPYKQAVIPYLDKLSELAQVTRSVNTILNDDGRLIGFTSDGEGAWVALQRAGIVLENKNILILGSGGAARAIAFALALRAKVATIYILGIVKKEINALVQDLTTATGSRVIGKFLTKETLKETLQDARVIIHATPVGMYPKVKESLIPKRLLEKDMVIFDIVYTPLKTKLLTEASQRGCQCIPGIEMFIEQAAFQFELWTGQKAPRLTMRRVVQRELMKQY